MGTNDTSEARSPNSPYASAGIGVVEHLEAPPAVLRKHALTDPQEGHLVLEVQPTLTTCARCRQSIVQGVIAGASQTWATAVDGDPWCQGGSHLPKAGR